MRGQLSRRADGLARQAVALTIGRGLAAVISMVWLAIAAHLLTVADFGDLSLLLSLGSIFIVLTDPGFTLLLSATIPGATSTARGQILFVARRRLWLAAIAVVALTTAFLVSAGDRRPALPLVFAVSVLATAFYSSVTAGMRGLGSVWPDGANEVASRVLVLAVGAAWLAHGGGILAAVAVYAGADLVSALVLGVLLVTRVPSGPEAVDPAPYRLRQTAPLAAALMMGTVYYRLDVWLLALISGPSAVALYAAPYRLLDGLMLPAGAVASLILPHLARRRTQGDGRQAARVTAIVFGITALAAAVLAIAREPVLSVVFGKAYLPSAGVFVILLASAPFGAAIMVLGPVVALHRRKEFVGDVAAALILNAVLNVSLIPAWGTMGAGAANLVSQTLLAIVLLYGALHSTTAAGGRGSP